MNTDPKKIWTPDQKLPESVRKMAFLFFLEGFKEALRRPPMHAYEVESEYRRCIDIAKAVHKIDAENDEPKS